MRMTAGIAGLALLLAAGSSAAEEAIDFKKTEKGAGELFRGMGQEIQRSGILGGKDGKKDGKKDAKKEAKKEVKKEEK